MAAWDRKAEAGDTVVVPAGTTYHMLGGVMAANKTNVTLVIAGRLLATADFDRWPLVGGGYVGFLVFSASQGITITGGGEIHGGGLPWSLRAKRREKKKKEKRKKEKESKRTRKKEKGNKSNEKAPWQSRLEHSTMLQNVVRDMKTSTMISFFKFYFLLIWIHLIERRWNKMLLPQIFGPLK